MRTRVQMLAVQLRNAPWLQRLQAAVSGEAGSQTAEYVMLGGVAAAACGALIALLRSKTLMGRLVGSAFNALISFIGSWF